MFEDDTAVTADIQPQSSGASNGERDANGHFSKGNRLAFKPGQSGNPKGRPKSLTLSEAYRRKLAELIPNDLEERNFAEIIATVVIMDAAKGSLEAAKEIADRTEGKAKMSGDFNLNLTDWREMAAQAGLTEAEVVRQARLLLRQRADDRRSPEGDQRATEERVTGSVLPR